MGAKARPRPKRMAEKLLRIRLALGLSQNELIRRLNSEEPLTQNRISDYELGTREPPITVVMQYAQVANVYMEVIADDGLDLPAKLPSAPKHEGVRRRRAR